MSIPQLPVAPLDKCLQTHFSSLLCIQVSPDTIPATVDQIAENYRVLPTLPSPDCLCRVLPSIAIFAKFCWFCPFMTSFLCSEPTLSAFRHCSASALHLLQSITVLNIHHSCQDMPPSCLCHQVLVWMPTHTKLCPSLKTKVVTDHPIKRIRRPCRYGLFYTNCIQQL